MSIIIFSAQADESISKYNEFMEYSELFELEEISTDILSKAYFEGLGLYEFNLLMFQENEGRNNEIYYSALICGKAKNNSDNQYWVLGDYNKYPKSNFERGRKWHRNAIISEVRAASEIGFFVKENVINNSDIKYFLDYWNFDTNKILKRLVFDYFWEECTGEKPYLEDISSDKNFQLPSNSAN